MKNLYKKRIDRAKLALASLGEICTRPQFGGYGVLVGGVMFGLFLQGELYLRATAHIEAEFLQQGMTRLRYLRRGLPLTLKYYRITEALWADETQLLALATLAVESARREGNEKQGDTRLKALPNIGLNLEGQLLQAGIGNPAELKAQGAKACYLKLDTEKTPLSIRVLFALEGAITGYHEAALPPERREELRSWYESIHPAAKK